LLTWNLRLLNLLSASIGNPSNGTALAMHLKCLSCDKPINPFALHPNSLDEEDRVTWSRDMNDSPKARPSSTGFNKGGLLTSKSTSQLPPVGGGPAVGTSLFPLSRLADLSWQNIDRTAAKSRQGTSSGKGPTGKASSLAQMNTSITTPGVQGSYLSRS
jgi:hypothetical protein